MKHTKKFAASAMAAALVLPGTAAFASGGSDDMMHEDKAKNVTVKTKAADLRATLDQLLSEHFVLAVMDMKKQYDGSKDAEYYEAALKQNALDMTPAIASVYGDEGAKQFEKIFVDHNKYTTDLVKAVKADDQEGINASKAETEEFVQDLSTFLDAATEGELPKEAAEEVLRAHEADVYKTFQEYAAGDYEGSYNTFREGYSRMYDISKALSVAITTQMPEKFDNSKADTKAADLRSTLNSLAAEHVALANLSMTAGVDQAKDYDAANWAEDMHTADFKAAIKSIYGEAGADQFEQAWTKNHIEAQANLVTAAINDDKKMMADAQDMLKMFSNDFGAFLGAATEENLPTKAAQEAVAGHETYVQDTFMQYTEGDYKGSVDTFRESYAYMYGVGENLGNAIVMQSPEKFMDGTPGSMPNTGNGGMSDTSNNATTGALALFGLALGAAGIVVARKRQNA
ncbi:copper amine oxidase [Exiguobacterium sp. N4-1P]|uniref:copper amine oxidase n=5 Tax=unclassified Exiguobacterium TaxID=2644629 RepID=UPI000B58FA17|nr:copper amine oxidase [Exiguobacterium sp. N4-1P]ASI34301.1 copper amine oxidase [Exiguobacterium sp. N4-1P]